MSMITFPYIFVDEIKLYDIIMNDALAVGVSIISAKEIDEINILEASRKGMIESYKEANKKIKIDVLLTDAMKIDTLSIPVEKIIKGDAKSVSIAAASIVAKVTRDHLMEEYDRQYPGYGFASNKGYGAEAHIKALKEIGPCPIHRRSFIKNFV